MKSYDKTSEKENFKYQQSNKIIFVTITTEDSTTMLC